MEFGMFVSWVVVGLLAGWLAGAASAVQVSPPLPQGQNGRSCSSGTCF